MEGRDDSQKDLRRSDHETAADRPVLQQEGLRQGGCAAPGDVGRHHGPGPRFNAKGIAPFSLGGQSRWTNMMWLEFLFDRIGGPEVFDAIYGEKPTPGPTLP